MKKITCMFCFACFTLAGCTERRQQPASPWLMITDDIGRAVTFANPPQRIVSLAPSITEMLFAVDSGATLVGVTDYCNYPLAAKSKPSVGGMVHPNIERIAELSPDLILVTVEGNSKEDFTKLESLGYRLFVTNPRTIEDIFTTLRRIGIILGRDSASARLVRSLRDEEHSIQNIVRGEKKPTIFAIISLQPLMTAGPSTFIHHVIAEAGGTNIAEKSLVAYPVFNREEIIRRQPDFLVVMSDAAHSTETLLREFPEWKNLKAVRLGNVLIIDGDLLSRPGPRLINGLEILARVFHGERFK